MEAGPRSSEAKVNSVSGRAAAESSLNRVAAKSSLAVGTTTRILIVHPFLCAESATSASFVTLVHCRRNSHLGTRPKPADLDSVRPNRHPSGTPAASRGHSLAIHLGGAVPTLCTDGAHYNSMLRYLRGRTRVRGAPKACSTVTRQHASVQAPPRFASPDYQGPSLHVLPRWRQTPCLVQLPLLPFPASSLRNP